MPGPKKIATQSLPGDNVSIVSDVDVSAEGLECPSTDGYITVRTVKTRTPEGVIEDVEKVWTRRGLEAWLKACPKVPVFIQLEGANDGDDPEKARPLYVIYDGIRIPVKKGRSVMVALPIAEIIANMQTKYRTAQSRGIDLYTINPHDPSDRGYEIPSLAAV